MNDLSRIALITIVAVPAALLSIGSKASQSDDDAHVERGKYLVAFGGCSDCHTPLKPGPNGLEPDMTRFLSGHPAEIRLPAPDLRPGPWFATTAGMTAWAGPWGVSYASNLTPDANTGLGIWTEEIFLKAMKTGRHMGSGREILPPMPWQSVSKLSDDDLKAIYAYLRSLPPIRNQVPSPVPPGGKPAYE